MTSSFKVTFKTYKLMGIHRSNPPYVCIQLCIGANTHFRSNSDRAFLMFLLHALSEEPNKLQSQDFTVDYPCKSLCHVSITVTLTQFPGHQGQFFFDFFMTCISEEAN